MTDIDYLVVTDGICEPNVYQRATYRYSPLMRYVFLAPACCRWPWLGKVVLALSDALCGWLIADMGGRRELWDWNPYVIAMSCRGSFDSVAMALVLLALRGAGRSGAGPEGAGGEEAGVTTDASARSPPGPARLLDRRLAAAALAYGLAVHLRIWPVVLAPRLWVELGLARGLAFGTASFCVVLLCTAVAEAGDPGYVRNGVLYHLGGRVDHRHNLSALWPCMLELRKGASSALRPGPLRAALACAKLLQVAGALVPAWGAWARARRERARGAAGSAAENPAGDRLAALCRDAAATALCFVAFNSVATTQYFLWFLAPLIPALGPRASLARVLLAFAPFAALVAAWMLAGYLFEFRDKDSSPAMAGIGAALVLAYGPVLELLYGRGGGPPGPGRGRKQRWGGRGASGS